MENIAWMAWTPPTALFFVLLAGTLVVSWASYRFFENPIRQVGYRLARANAASPVLTSA